MKKISNESTYIANLDDTYNADYGKITEEDYRNLYKYIDENYDYALYVDGFVSNLPKIKYLDLTFNYFNNEYYDLNQYIFNLSKGEAIDFNYDFSSGEIPVYLGKGLEKTYNMGSIINVYDPVLRKNLNYKVVGILKPNVNHSNFYALNSKNYYNFSVFIPVNKDFIFNASSDLYVNGLMDMIILHSNVEETKKLSNYIYDMTGIKLDYNSQQQNEEFFKKYHFSALKAIIIITFVIVSAIIILTIWNALISIRLMIKDFTINLLVGLSYQKLKKILYVLLCGLFSIDILGIILVTAVSRYQFWIEKKATFMTYGFLGLILEDWISIFVVIFINILLGYIITLFSMKKIKNMPISTGLIINE